MTDKHDESSDPTPGRRRKPGKLEHPGVKPRLIRDIALTNMSQGQLAERYDVVQSSISEFISRNRARIEAVRVDSENEYAGVWIADKLNRIEAYAEQVNRIRDLLGGERDNEEQGKEQGPLRSDEEAGLMRVAQSALKSVAEELGQLTTRAKIDASGEIGVRVEMVGVDPDDV